VAIRRIDELKDLERCIELQKLIWGFEDIDIVPLPMFVVAAKVGGQVFGAFDGEQMVGFVMAVPGYRHGHPYLHSHMAALLPEYQGQGIGRQLKLRQRADALDRGIKLVEWTFDPLEFRNAYFNFQRLGVIARRYRPQPVRRDLQPPARRPAHRPPGGGVVAGRAPGGGHHRRSPGGAHGAARAHPRSQRHP
jgi:predicted GNAT superfamily acetyltransferase